MFDVVGIGASSVDYVYRLPSAPQFHGPASKMRLVGHGVSCGGQVATAMATCAAFGLRAAYAGAVGDDDDGRRLLEALTGRDVNVSLTVRRRGGSQFAAVLVDDSSGERAVLWDRPDSLLLADEHLPVAALQAARSVLVDDVDPRASLAAARIARAAGVPVVTDLDHVTPLTGDLIRTASHPILSEHLPQALTGERDLERALRAMHAWNPGLLTVTVGERGAVALDGDHFVEVEGFRVSAVDTTGSGDVFRGAFIAGLLQGLAVAELLRFANAAAAVSCTRSGALDGVPALAEVANLLRGDEVRRRSPAPESSDT
ncbi:MAG: carbohydrate kinase family protein [Vicinamibacterales bacterium]